MFGIHVAKMYFLSLHNIIHACCVQAYILFRETASLLSRLIFATAQIRFSYSAMGDFCMGENPFEDTLLNFTHKVNCCCQLEQDKLISSEDSKSQLVLSIS